MAGKALSKAEIIAKTVEKIKEKYPESTLGVYKDLGRTRGKNLLSTGSVSADWVLGGGLAKQTCLVGYPSSGKTTLALTAIAQYQKEHPDAGIIYCDSEFALDLDYATKLGVDIDSMILLQPSTSEEGYNIIEKFIESGIADIVVIDSVASMIPYELTEGEYGQSVQIGRMATLTTRAVARINRLAGLHENTHVIWINQYKKATQVGMFDLSSPEQMGTKYYMPGGQQFPFFMGQIVQITRTGQLKQGKEILSNVITVKTTKNKVGIPYRQGETVITFAKGIDREAELTTLGLAQGLIIQKGSMYEFAPEVECEDRINGRVKVGKYIEDHPDVADRLEAALRNKLFETDAKKIEIDRDMGADEDGSEEETTAEEE